MYLIEKSEIESEIVLEFLMMLSMMPRTYQELTQRMLPELFRIDLDVEMIDHAADTHDHKLYKND